MSNPVLSALVLLTFLVSVAALAVALVALRGSGVRRRQDLPVPSDVAGLRAEVERLRDAGAHAVQQLGVVRYDAFGDMGGRLSWSMALVDRDGTGVVLTSIHGRSEARTYAKKVTAWACEQAMSPEETEAVASARGSRG
jgi:hypothetical protein